MLRTENNNVVKIEGVLSEIDLKTNSYNKNGQNVDCIGGSIKVRVTQKLNGVDMELDIPVYLFANKLTKAGKPNPAYTSIEHVMNEFVSIAAGGFEKADRIRITKGNIRMNEYYNPNGTLNSYPRINATFVSKITDLTKYNPEATFSADFMIGSMGAELDKDGVEIENRYKVRGILPQYGNTVDVIDFYATSPKVIDVVSSSWSQGDTVRVNGKLNFSSRVEEHEIPVDFGEPRVEKRTISVSELVITGGSAAPLDGDFAYDADEIQEALQNRQAHLADLKAKAESKAKATPAKKPSFEDVGF